MWVCNFRIKYAFQYYCSPYHLTALNRLFLRPYNLIYHYNLFRPFSQATQNIKTSHNTSKIYKQIQNTTPTPFLDSTTNISSSTSYK